MKRIRHSPRPDFRAEAEQERSAAVRSFLSALAAYQVGDLRRASNRLAWARYHLQLGAQAAERDAEEARRGAAERATESP